MIATSSQESDRGCALVLAANLDNRLRTLLESFFVELSTKKLNAVFEGNGCLATFSSRIKLSYALGLLGEDERHDLDIIRDIRNNFAHDESTITFTSKAVSDRCKSLRLYREMVTDHSGFEISRNSSRTKFQIVSVSLCLSLSDRATLTGDAKRIVPPSNSILPKTKPSSG